jgi:hypothetical protein
MQSDVAEFENSFAGNAENGATSASLYRPLTPTLSP